MFISAASVNQVFELCQKEEIYEGILKKFFKKKSERDEFRQELWLYLLQKPVEVLKAWNEKYFKYLYVKIIQKQVISNSSDWHVKFREPQNQLLEYIPDQPQEPEIEFLLNEERQLNEQEKKKKISLINSALNFYIKHDPLFKVEAELFKMYYYEGLSIRQIQKRMHNISTFTVWQGIQYATLLIRFYINKHSKK